MSLSSLLVQREIVTIREIEEALARQVLYGGDLITNLLEVSSPSEDALIAVAAELHGLPPVPGGVLPVADPEAQRLVPLEVVTTHQIAPISLDRYGLVIAVFEPLSRQAEQELAFALAMPIAQRLTTHVRIREALARDYGLPLERRDGRLLARLRGEYVASTSSLPPRVADVVAPAPRAPSAPKVRRTMQGMPAAPQLAEPRAVQLLKRSNAPPAPLPRRRGPLTADVARDELDAASERDEVFNLLFEFARQYFDYTVMFTVHGDVAEGRDAFGEGASREQVARIGVPLDLPSVLATARERRSVVTARPAEGGLDTVLMSDLGRSPKGVLTVFPVTVRNRVVALLVGDGGPEGVESAAVGDVLGMTTHATAAFERVIMRKKLRGTVPPGHAEVPRTKSSPAAASAVPGSRIAGVDDLADQLSEMLEAPPDPAPRSDRSIPPTNVSPTADEITLMSAEPAEGSGEWPGPRESVELVSPEPPPRNVLVRKPSGAPIPREEPESVPRLAGREDSDGKGRGPRSRRAEAPALEFSRRAPSEAPRTERDGSPDLEGFSLGFAGDEVERALLAEIHGGAPPSPTRNDDEPAQLSVDGLSPPHRASGSGELARIDVRGEAPSSAEGVPSPNASPPATTRDPEPPRMTPASPDARAPSPVVLTAPHADLTPRSPSAAPAPSPAAAEDAPPVAIPKSPGVPLGSTLTSGLPVLPGPKAPRSAPPPSERYSAAAHRPPTSRSSAPGPLPSVIVDVGEEYVELVRRVVERREDGRDEAVESTLTRAGGAAMPAIMARFPGDDALDPDKILAGTLPRVGECGRVLRLIAAQRRTALPYVLACVEDASPLRRFWATFLLTELPYVDALDALVRRVFDEDERVRAVARAAGRASAEALPGLFVDRVATHAADRALSLERRTQAVEAMGASHDRAAVPLLVDLLDGETTDKAREALIEITRQDFGEDRAAWRRWWSAHKDQHRIEWLIDALMHEHRAVRAAAGEELKATTKEFFGYYDDLPKRERMRAQSKFLEWWKTTGRLKFAGTARG